jgi:TRAP-type mannitol/chloroaromatic compound transport system permease large subunit
MTEGLLGLGIMMLLALLRIPIAISMGVVGFIGVAYLRDWNFAPAMAMVETKVYETGRNYTLSVVPLFILMGNFVTRAGMSARSAARRSQPPPPWPRWPIRP